MKAAQIESIAEVVVQQTASASAKVGYLSSLSISALWALFGSVLLSLLYGRTILLNLTSGVLGGNVDGYENLWDYYWLKTAIFDLHRSPYFTDYIYYPTGISLRFHTLNPLNGLITLPFNLTIGYVPTTNLLFLLALCLTVFFAFLLIRDIVGNPWSAFAGAALFTFANHNLFGHFQAGQAEKVSAEWLPLYFLFLFRMLHGVPVWEQPVPGRLPQPACFNRGKWKLYLALSVLTLLALTFTDWQYVLHAVLATLLIFVSLLVSRQYRHEKQRIFGKLAIIGGVYTVLVGPTLLLPMIQEAVAEPWLNVSYQSTRRAIDLFDFFLPGTGNPGYLAYALALLGLWTALKTGGKTRNSLFPWAVLTLGFNLLALGPNLKIGGKETDVPLPYALIQNLPILNIGRDPGRYNLLATLGLGVLVAVGLNAAVAWAAAMFSIKGNTYSLLRWGTLCVALFLLLNGFMAASGNVQMDPPVWPEFYKQIAKDKEPYSLLELPAFTEKGLGENHYTMYQVLHNKPRFGGRWARDHKLTNPDNFMKTSSLYHRLFLLDYPKDMQQYYYPSKDFLLTPTDYKTQGLAILNRYQTRYIVLYKDALYPGWNEGDFQEIMSRIMSKKPRPFYEDSLMRVYAVPTALPIPLSSTLTLDVGNGWSTSETRSDGKVFRLSDAIKGSEAELYTMNLSSEPVPAVLQFTAYAIRQPRTLKVKLNGAEAAGITLRPEDPSPFTVTITIPSGNNKISFSSPQPPLASANPQEDTRLLSFGMYDVSLTPR